MKRDYMFGDGVATRIAEPKMLRIVFASQCVGLSSEVWIWRQIVRFRRIMPRVLTWRYLNREVFPLNGVEVHELPFDFDPQGCWSRRVRNLRGLITGNVYASRGRELEALQSYLVREKPSAMLCHFAYVALRLLDIAAGLGIRVVAHFHGRDITSMLRSRAYRRSLLKNLHRFEDIVVVGSHQKQWLVEQGCRPDRVHVIPCGVPTDEFVPAARTLCETIRFIAVARLVEQKGLDYTLNAFALTRQRVPGSFLTIVGDGPLKADLEKLAADLGIADRVRFAGWLSPQEVRCELAASDVFLQHSIVSSEGDSEGFGVTVAEAASSGLPVVCSLSTGLVDQVVEGTTGFLIPQRDAETMAARMIQLAEDPGIRTRLGAAGRQRAVSCFDVAKQVRELEEVLIRASTKTRA